ncbi:hypothetical protein PG2001B_1732 [Bifidobacterium pseudolongum subsp. globosum]|uniref:Replication protein n=1 Tax=Bifidobacterium pseudolongum subsp. globosum TaxID=1690 RepID=A0A4Q5AT42_9BIFI|nr:protein rep [Bifidobacterium pseudolongum]RYQ36200.1 hypothetical protein PG2001B_1732 [Bifidobacterium pseudolongum subsp. globosum]
MSVNSESVSASASSPSSTEVGAPLVNRKVLSQDVPESESRPRIMHRWAIRRASQRVLCAAIPKEEWPRVVRCGWSMGALVSLLGQEGRTSWSGIEHCNSLWACPICSARIREGRRNEIQEGFERSKKLGWSAFFVTFTVPHTIDTPLDQSLGAIREAYARMRRYSSLRDFWSAVEGVIKATEIQVGNNGFHPHLHCVYFTRESSIDEAALKRSWARAVVKAGLARPSETVGVVVKEATSSGISNYLTKIQENKISLELTRSDLKRGRVNDESGSSWHCSPFDLLDPDIELPISMAQRQRLWVDYVRATKGVSAIRWSKGLKKKLSIGEVSDDDLGALDPNEVEAQLVFLRKEYQRLFKDSPELLAKAQQLFAAQRYEEVLNLGIGELILDDGSNLPDTDSATYSDPWESVA